MQNHASRNALPPLSAEPLVSICIPAYNGSKWIVDAIRSAVAQTYARVEVLVVDDQSTDDTAALARGLADPRVRVECNDRNLGLVGNWNRAIKLARGEFVKFLFQDDLLYADCCRRMVALFQKHPTVGLVFSRRDVLLEDAHDPGAIEWTRRFGILDNRFDQIAEFNSGSRLFEDYYQKRFAGNFVGEPTSVMVRTECFNRLGYFNARLYQLPDCEMWIRIMYYYDIGFISEPLAAFRLHTHSTTSSNKAVGRDWLDRVWLLEGLLQHPEIRATHSMMSRMRLPLGLRALQAEVRRALSGMPTPLRNRLRGLSAYLVYRLRRMLGSAPDLHREIC